MTATRIGIITLLLGQTVALPPAAAADKRGPHGFIYGTVETEGGHRYSGRLRWGTEEAFWDDLFNSTKADLPYLEKHGEKKRQRNRIRIFGITVGYHWDDADTSRMYIARFGDIAEIEVLGDQKIKVTMKDRKTYKMDGGSNDIGEAVFVSDSELGDVKLEWSRIERISFEPTPATIHPPAQRLYGVLETEDGRFEGYVQWDTQECLSTDKLDGETDDGDLSIEMGKIRSIAKRDRSGSSVELEDGRSLVLEGTNDVDSSLRGVWIEDPRYGRIKASWEAFESLELKDVETTGRAYGDYAPSKPLRGTVTDRDGAKHSGPLVFDLDETEDWELLNGELDGVEYYIPFSLIRSIEPVGDESKIALKGGGELLLGEGQDVSDANDGVVILGTAGHETYLPWAEVARIDLE